MAGHGWPWLAMASHGTPWPAMARHGVPWRAMRGRHGGNKLMPLFLQYFSLSAPFSGVTGKTKEGGQSKKKGGKASGWAPEIRPKHRKSLPNGRQQEPQGGGAKRRPLGVLVVYHLVSISCFGMISGAHPEAFPHFLLGLSTFLGFPTLRKID